MPRRKRREKPSEIRPGTAVAKKLQRELQEYMGTGKPQPTRQVPRGHPAPPRFDDVEDGMPGPLPAAPMPSILRESRRRAPPTPRTVTPRIPPQTSVQQAPPSPKAGEVPLQRTERETVVTPSSAPRYSLPEAAYADPLVEAVHEPQQLTAPICPLLGRECLHEWCEWWDGISQCQVGFLAGQLSQSTGRLQALRDWLEFRLGSSPHQ